VVAGFEVSIDGRFSGVHRGTVAATVAVLGAVAMAAAWRPVAIASRVDPVIALRYE